MNPLTQKTERNFFVGHGGHGDPRNLEVCLVNVQPPRRFSRLSRWPRRSSNTGTESSNGKNRR